MPYMASSIDGRNESFQRLKPSAVALSQALLTIHATQRDVKLVQDRLEALHSTVSSLVSAHGFFDGTLADYVFFPVSQVLKSSQKVSLGCLESALSIVAILIRSGWSSGIQQQLAQQLLVLCTLLASDNPLIANTTQTTPELQKNAISCLMELFVALGKGIAGTRLFTNDASLLQLGQTLSTLLQAAQKSNAPAVQESAIHAVKAVMSLNLPTQTLLNFLPGVVSTLTKVLSIQHGQRKQPETLIASLETISRLLKEVFHDYAEPKSNATPSAAPSTAAIHQAGAADSLEVAIPQIRLALSNIVRLREHDRYDVRSALGRLCVTILRHCRKTLHNCTQLSLETILALTVQERMSELHFEIVMLMTTDASMLSALQKTLFDWCQSLVRIIQANDDDAKRRRLEQLGSAYQCLVEVGIDLSTTNQILAHTLRDCVASTLQQTRNPNQSDLNANTVMSIQLPTHKGGLRSIGDFSAIIASPSQSSVVKSIQDLVELISANDASHGILNSFVDALTTSREDNLVANIWLSLRYLHKSMQRSSELDLLIDTDDSGTTFDAHTEEIYSFALSYLTHRSDEQSPVLTSMALQALALRARSAGVDFRYELVDALYPVLHSLATPQQTVQHDSMVTLNAFTQACGYSSVTSLIVENVDYLTNAVAMKLNSFDVSPQAPQVLLMMVRLAGPTLVPYLKDSIDSIFAALEDYHGYPVLVELLFKTLSVVAEEGSKTPLLDATGDMPLLTVHRGFKSWEPIRVIDLAAAIRERKSTALPLPDEPIESESAPRRPWASEDSKRADAIQPVQPMPDEQEQGPPAPRTYNIILKIAEHTQHFLPSASPTLRISLLSLIRTTVPAIARHENTFLPLVNTLWPEIVSRLDDNEASICAAALDIIAVLCEHAKDFMRSRITDLWPHLRTIWRAVVNEMTIPISTLTSKPSTSNTNSSTLR